MKLRAYIAALHAAILAILLAASPAGSGSMPLLGVGNVGGGAGSAVLTFQGEQGWSFSHSATNSPNTFAAMAIGSAFANRKVIAVIVTGGSYNGAASAVTIGGVTATFVSTAGSGAGSFSGIITYAWADVPTGTTADVVMTGAASFGDGAIYCAVYTFDKSLAVNASPTTNIVNSGSGTSQTTTLNTGAGGFIISALAIAQLSGASAQSLTAATEASLVGTNDALAGSSVAAVASKKSGSASNSPTSVTWSWTTSAQALGGLLAWN